MARWSSVLDCGENRAVVAVTVVVVTEMTVVVVIVVAFVVVTETAVVVVIAIEHAVNAILPCEPVNIFPLPIAFESTQAAPQSTWSNEDA